MTYTLLIIIIVAISIVLLLAVSLYVVSKGHDKKLARQEVIYTDIVWKNKLQIGLKERFGEYTLALDKINFILLYIDFKESKERVMMIDLWDLKSAEVVTQYKNDQDNIFTLTHANENVISLELVLTRCGLNSYEHRLQVYNKSNASQDFFITRKRIYHWAQDINNLLRSLLQAKEEEKLLLGSNQV